MNPNRQFDCLQKARDSAKMRKWDRMFVWLDHAKKVRSLSELQIYNLKKEVGEEKFHELKLEKYLKITLISLVLFSSLGCNQLHNAHSVPPNNTPPDIYTVTGKTAVDFQVIQPVRCVNSMIRVWVKTESDADFRELNEYEFKALTDGVGGGGVEFKKRVEIQPSGSLVIYQECSAPKGSDYKIQSMLVQK